MFKITKNKLRSYFFNSKDLKNFSLDSNINAIYDKKIESGKKLILGTFVARSGTRWLCDIFNSHNSVTATVERFMEAETFFRYVNYNSLPIDLSGVYALLKNGIINDWKKSDLSVVFSPFFSHSIHQLSEVLKPKEFILAITEPKFVVQSLYNKGFFKENYFYSNKEKVIGFQPHVGTKSVHFFGRVVPSGKDYEYWSNLTRIGKISWWGNKIISDIYLQITKIDKKKVFIFDLALADQNYEYYYNLANQFNLFPKINERDFLLLKSKTVKKNDNSPHQWSHKENEEFERETSSWHKIYKNIYKNYKNFNTNS